jgi:hypothetical protein
MGTRRVLKIGHFANMCTPNDAAIAWIVGIAGVNYSAMGVCPQNRLGVEYSTQRTSDEGHARSGGANTICVWVTTAHSLPASDFRSVCHTIVVRPR